MSSEAFQRLIEIVAQLRNPEGGCPWDLEQTHATLKPYLIEESYEVLDAIDNAPQKLAGELGDVLLQVVLHSQIASEEKRFTIEDVIRSISEKMVRRHPHVFGDVTAKDSSTVLKNWERLKQDELKSDESILDGVPRGMPALLRGHRVGEKAARVGFEWPTVEGVRDKVFEEMREFLEVSCDPNPSREKLADELGDVLFSLSQLSRRLDLNAEEILHRAVDKFTDRFRAMEKAAPKPLRDMTIDELDAEWEKVKAARTNP